MSNIKMLILDVDGTLTDGHIYMGKTGEIMKAFNAHDAVGLRLLAERGIITIILTGRESKIVTNRAKEMKITKVYQNIQNKKEKLQEIKKEFKIKKENIGYIGDDLNDYEAMKECSFKACPNDAVEEIKKICNYISPHKCKDAAVRDIIDNAILKKIEK